MKTLETIKNEIEAKATEAVIHEDEQNNKLVPLSARLADYYEMKRNPPKKLSTGFSTLDEILGGGLEESGRLLILGKFSESCTQGSDYISSREKLTP